MFPVSIDGEFSLDTPQEEASSVLERYRAELAELGADEIERLDDAVTFTSRMWRHPFRLNTHVLNPVARGRICVERVGTLRIRYRFDVTDMLVAVTALAIGISAPGLFATRDTSSFIGLAAIVWGWLFGANYLIAAIRLPLLTRRIAKRR